MMRKTVIEGRHHAWTGTTRLYPLHFINYCRLQRGDRTMQIGQTRSEDMLMSNWYESCLQIANLTRKDPDIMYGLDATENLNTRGYIRGL